MRRAAFVATGWAIAAGIVWLSLMPLPPQVNVDQIDKFEHLIAYGMLMFWFCLLYARRNTRIAYGALWVAMGVGLEFAQGQTGYRSFEVNDMVANALGVLIGGAAAFAIPEGLAGKLR